jgi:three-Cys-motif partner protein
MSEHYRNREQAIAKHVMLEGYLERLAYKVGSRGGTINYIDGFSGPWQSNDEQLSDTSPFIALSQLTTARATLAAKGAPPKFRCLFVEKDQAAHARLAALRVKFPAIEIHTLNGEFEALIDDAHRFARAGHDPFTFVFIDPTGWTGYPLARIKPLLELRRVEVLVNFMTDWVKRFVDAEMPAIEPTFIELFGTMDYREAWKELSGQDREDAIVRAYCQCLGNAGNFPHCCSTVVLNPRSDRTHYNLIYATRSLIGLRTFREVERRALETQDVVRSDLQRQTRQAHGQTELFDARTLSTRYIDQLAARYRAEAKNLLDAILLTCDSHQYDGVAAQLMHLPMVGEHQVKEWLLTRQKAKTIELQLPPRKRVPELLRGDQLRVIRHRSGN